MISSVYALAWVPCVEAISHYINYWSINSQLEGQCFIVQINTSGKELPTHSQCRCDLPLIMWCEYVYVYLFEFLSVCVQGLTKHKFLTCPFYYLNEAHLVTFLCLLSQIMIHYSFSCHNDSRLCRLLVKMIIMNGEYHKRYQ